MKEYETAIAHLTRSTEEGWRFHPLEDHLAAVATLAAHFARGIGADWARLAGLWHDLGKYAPQFQAMIRRESGYDPEEKPIPGPRNHSTAGALYAIDKLNQAGRLLAYLIAGHHAGLPDWHGEGDAAAALSQRLQDRTHLAALPLERIPAALLNPDLPAKQALPGFPDGLHLWLRMLFSCLVDADFLDTEAFMAPDKAALRASCADVAALQAQLDTYLARFDAAAPTPVNRLRAEVLQQCREKAAEEPGLFSLTVPTGGGKTLSSIAFALAHAQRHGKHRVIYAIPYTSIIEQTVDIYREIFGEAVLEHHSSLDPDKESVQSRLAAENWDAPIVVTTNVQLFESLFAARPSRCRKLHNLVNSVIVLDEAQTLPPELLQPILDVMNLLVRHYGVSIVLCTATQPALSHVGSFGRQLRGLEGVREIIDAPEELFARLERVEVLMPHDLQHGEDWDAIAAKVGACETALAIVNTRQDCRELWRRLPAGTIHLSASMCGAHRAQTIAEIRCRLAAGEPVRVVSTQLIEAGVDVDFPVVFRALAGLDSIAQAAGRCNREGRRERGIVHVFVPPKPAPPGQLRRAAQTTVSLCAGRIINPLAPQHFADYFRHFYCAAPSWDEYGIHDLLTRDARRLEIQFRSAAEKFRYIDDADSQPILVWWDDSRSLIGTLEKEGPTRWLMRKLQRYSVNLPHRLVAHLVDTGEVREVFPGIFAQSVDTLYHSQLGVVIDNDMPLVF
ncbi:MAG: CRISPR-associated helicase Cas3' [Rhodocyclaceae bacterium]|nr:CRISPR-associated helicase Cas3' [Rhodocyclaceae bacterium]